MEIRISKQRLVLLSASVVLLLMGYILYSHLANFGKHEIPVVVSDNLPNKVKPEDPGGLKIPYQDIRVYERLSSTPSEEIKVEKLLPSKEKIVPLKPTTLSLNEGKNKSSERKLENKLSSEELNKPLSLEKEKLKAENKLPAVDLKSDSISKTVEEKKRVDAKPTQKNKSQSASLKSSSKLASKTLASNAHSKYRVQLLSVKSNEGAEKEWLRLNTKYGSLFKGHKKHVQKIDIADKGTFYRLQVGSFLTRSEANLFCDQVKNQSNQKLGCYPVKSK